MAIVIKAFILCATDDPAEAMEAAYASMASGVFESSNPILDFALGVEHVVEIDDSYRDGEFVGQVPNAAHLQAANDVNFPC